MASFGMKIVILGWKCQILRRRNWIITILELIIPLAIFLLLSIIYNTFLVDTSGSKGSIEVSSRERDFHQFFILMDNLHIGYTPRNNFTDNIVMHAVKNIQEIAPYANITKEAIQTEKELSLWLEKVSVAYSTKDEIKPEMGIVFSEIDSKNDRYKYTIRTTDPNMITNEVSSEMDPMVYSWSSLFLAIQIVLDQVFLRNAGVRDDLPWLFGDLPSKLNIFGWMMPLLYFFLIFAYLFLVVSVMKDVVDEKECGTKELMKIIKVDSWMIWVHWFVYTMMVQLPVIVGATIILAVWKPVVISAGAFIVFLLFLLFTINFIIMLFAISCLFYKTTRALTSCLFGWFVINLLISIVVITKPDKVSSFLEIILSLYPLLNLCWALSSLWSFDAYGTEWKWTHLFSKGFTKFRIPVGVSIIQFIISTILCTFILIYLDAIFPGPYGVPKPFAFVCEWFRDRLRPRDPYKDDDIIHESPESFEPVSRNANVGIVVRGLQKRFGVFKKIVAVEKVDLDIYQGEIMALLGHNGAGKTTTMSMITGMTAPTRGVIMFEGKNITVNKKHFRENLGLCPQHNLYFSKLTVIEHLMFFGMLKGMTYSESKKSGKSLLFSLHMLDKAKTRGSELSGGMKRRLCLAVSLTGNPKVLILDEPTSGLDPQTRRVLWDIILGMRGQRTVLITTHFMEEADVLGDRIAIMDHGRVVCCGTSMFLKKLFGAGYRVHVLKKSEASVQDISRVVKQNIAESQVNVISNNQVDYIINEEFLGRFPSLFSALESQKEDLKITGITVTCASMEDVFLKVADLAIGSSAKPAEAGKPLSTLSNINEFKRLEGVQLFVQQVKALFERRLTQQIRHIVYLMIKSTFILIVMLLLVLYTQIERKKYQEQQELLLNLNVYPEATALIAYDKEFEGIGDISKKVAHSLSGPVKIFSSISDLDGYLKKESSDNNYNYVRQILFALTFKKTGIAIRYHSERNMHAPAIAINFLTNVLLQNKTNGSGMIQVVNHPFVNTKSSGICDKSKNTPIMLEMLVVYPYMLLFSVSFIILLGDFLWFVTEERTTGFKHQLFLAGASPPVYWCVNLIFDFCVYFIIAVIILIMFSIFGPHMRLVWFSLFLLVLFLQGWSGISLTYIYSLVCNSPGTSLALYNVLMICLGMFPALLLSTGVVEFFPSITFPLVLLIECVLSLNPVFAATMCVRYILRAIVFEEFCRVCTDEMCPVDSSTVLRMLTENDRSGILLYLYALVVTSFLYPSIVLLLDCGLGRKITLFVTDKEPDFSLPPDTDDDVKLLTTQVETFKYEGKNTPLRVESLEKTYMWGPRAVDKVSFLVQKGDCFGLLGVNGAGKSTTFKMLTAEILPDKGDACIGSFSVNTDRRRYMASVGYCPQFDAILPTLTGKEILSIIGKIRGIPSSELFDAVNAWLDAMGIREHGEKRCGTYSGGTKRKLSTAMALIGSPEVVFMDEPTTGVDPASRRKLWAAIKEMQKQGQAVVLTSHSMEECEALCTRLTIMVAGRMKCVGNVEYLKTKFGKGFTVLLKLNEHTPEEVAQLKEDFDRLFLDNSIKDEHDILIHYTVLDPNMSLSQLFADLLQFKGEHQIVDDFTASHTTLEEVFLSFASNTRE